MHDNPSSGSQIVPCRQTDGQDEANSSFFRDLAKALANKKRVHIILLVKLEKIASGIFRLLSEILLRRRLQVKFGILKSSFKRHFEILIIKPNRCTNFSNLFLEQNSTCLGQFLCPSSGVFHCTHSNTHRFADSLQAGTGRNWFRSVLFLLACYQQTCTTYTIAVFTVKNS